MGDSKRIVWPGVLLLCGVATTLGCYRGMEWAVLAFFDGNPAGDVAEALVKIRYMVGFYAFLIGTLAGIWTTMVAGAILVVEFVRMVTGGIEL